VASRAELERRVDELASRHSGHAFADAVRAYSDTLDERSRAELKAVLLARARVFEDTIHDRFEAKGWLRRTLDRIGDVERRARTRP
jgi:hypothetical protein